MPFRSLKVLSLTAAITLAPVTALAELAAPHGVDESLDAVDYLLPAGMVLFSNVVFWGFARTVLDAEYSRIGSSSIQRNFTVGFEWDADGFPINQIGHPYQGSLYHAAARASGHDFWVASLYTFLGSLQWEMFMENELPSYNDLITTTFSGAAFGETLYRLGSELLDPSTRGAGRAFSELGAAMIAPTMGLTRTLTGEIRASGFPDDSNVPRAAIFLGPDRIRSEAGELEFKSMRLGFNVEYGSYAPGSTFRPYDWFDLTTTLNLYAGSVQRAALDIKGLLIRWNFGCGSGTCLIGINQHYAYVDTPIFKVGTSSVGASLFGDVRLLDSWTLRTGLNINGIVLGGFNSLSPTTIERDYNLGSGGMTRAHASLRWTRSTSSKWLNHLEFKLGNTRYFLRIFDGFDGTEYAGISSAHLHLPVYGDVALAFGADIYDRQVVPDEGPNVYTTYYTEQIFLMWKF